MDLAESQDVALTVVIGDDERELAEHFFQPATIKGMIGETFERQKKLRE